MAMQIYANIALVFDIPCGTPIEFVLSFEWCSERVQNQREKKRRRREFANQNLLKLCVYPKERVFLSLFESG